MKKILIVDDNKDFLRSIEHYFTTKGWNVTTLTNGGEIGKLIKEQSFIEDNKTIHLSDFQCLILDHSLPIANGCEILEQIRELNDQPPSTIVLSGYLNRDIVENYFQLGATICCQKPISYESLNTIIDLLMLGDLESLRNNRKNIKTNHGYAVHDSIGTHIVKPFPTRPTNENISDTVAKREYFLKTYFKESIDSINPDSFIHIENPVLVIGRRWNSWYPSYFDVPGGSYVIIMPKYNNRNEAIIIDPGFKSLKILSEDLRIPVTDVTTCIISHNHPDHIGGIFEYLACRNALGEKSHLFCNSTSLRMFSDYENKKQIDDSNCDLLKKWDKTKFRKILISGFKTFHDEIGDKNDPRAIVIEFIEPNNNKTKMVILGDTEFHPNLVNSIFDLNIRLLVLHIGSAQLKEGTGKHLYIEGTRKLLLRLNAQLEDGGVPENHLLVLISEWGLEHASYEQLQEVGIKNIPDNFEGSPISDIINYLKKDLKHLNILPADIGLTVDIIDQNIYVNDNKNDKYSFENIHFNINGDGIKYSKKGI